MSNKRLIILSGVLLATATATVYTYLPKTSDTPPPAPAKPTVAKPATPPPPVAAKRPVAPPPLPMPEPMVEEEEELTEEQQVAAASQLLTSTDPTVRLEGAEQLGAYPNAEAEALLVQTLANDPDADVRNAAAQSLAYVEQPSNATVSALMAALDDQNEDVRAAALSALEDFLANSDAGSKRYNSLQSGLKQKAAVVSTPQDVRDAIHDILEEQANGE